MTEREGLPLTEPKKAEFFYGYVVVAITFLIMVVIGGTIYSFGVFLKPLSTEFGWSRAATSGAYSVFMVTHGLFYIITGRLNDRFGPRVVISGCGFFLGLGYLLMSQTSYLWNFYLFYGLFVAIGMGGGFVPLTSTVARWFIKRRGQMTGIAVSGIGFGTMIIPPVSSWLISNFGWRTSYILIGFMTSAIIIPAAQLLRGDPAQMREVLQNKKEENEGRSNVEVREFSLQKAMRTMQFWLLCGIYSIFGVLMQSIMVHIVPYFTDLGISATAAANVFVAIGGIGIVGRIVMGNFSDKIGNKSALIICFILMTAALAWLLLAKEMWMLYLFASVFGFAYGGLIALESTSIADLFGISSHGVIFGVIAFVVTIGGAIGPFTAGIVFDITGNYDQIFMICSILSVIGLILAAFITPGFRKNDNANCSKFRDGCQPGSINEPPSRKRTEY